MHRVMTKITETIGDSTGAIQTSIDPPENKYTRALHPNGARLKEGGGKLTWSGSFTLRLLTEAEHEVAFKALDGMAISFAGRTPVAKVTNNFGATFSHPTLGITDAPRDQ